MSTLYMLSQNTLFSTGYKFKNINYSATNNNTNKLYTITFYIIFNMLLK